MKILKLVTYWNLHEGQKLSLLNQLDIPYFSYGVDELCYLRKDAKIFDTSFKYWAHLF
jgi:hypothetical protein